MPDGKMIDYGSVKEWRLNGLLHRLRDRPAFIADDVKKWYNYGQLHRTNNKPAVINQNGTELYYVNGLLHREDGPAYKSDTIEKWAINGKLHRLNEPAYIETYGDENYISYYINGRLHREDGPALIEPNTKLWSLYIGTDVRHFNVSFDFYLQSKNGKTWRIVAGCRNFNFREAMAHWGPNGTNNKQAIELVKKGQQMLKDRKSAKTT